MTSVYKMNRAQLVAELQSLSMDIVGNINDLRESVKLGREIQKQFDSGVALEKKSILRTFFMSWREQAMSEEQLNNLYDEFLLERNWAHKNNFEPEYWCWTCKFGKACQFH